jgi:hypothetical protein
MAFIQIEGGDGGCQPDTGIGISTPAGFGIGADDFYQGKGILPMLLADDLAQQISQVFDVSTQGGGVFGHWRTFNTILYLWRL